MANVSVEQSEKRFKWDDKKDNLIKFIQKLTAKVDSFF